MSDTQSADGDQQSPGSVRRRGEALFVGRDRELAAMRDARRDGGRSVLIVGAAGVGKTRLAREAVAQAESDGSAVMWVRATASAAAIPLAAVVDLLPFEQLGGDPLRAFQAGLDMLNARAGGRPVVVGVDDAHLLDPGSAAYVLHLAQSGAFVVATVRSGQELPDAVTALWKDDGARRVELDALDAAESAALLEAQLDGPAEGVAAEWVYTMSAGNPLYLRELVTSAVEAGALSQETEDGLWRLRWRPAPSVALTELISSRLGGIGSAGQAALALLSVGEPLPASLVERIVAAETVAQLAAQGLVVVESAADDRMVRLAHPLYGEIARLRTAGERLDELRVRLAAVVRAHGPRPGDALRVASWLRDAGADIDAGLAVDAAAEAYAARDPALAAEFAEQAEREAGGWRATLLRGRALAALGRHSDAEQALAGLEGSVPLPADAVEYLFARVNVLVWGVRSGSRARALVERASRWWPDADWQEQVAGLRLMVTSGVGAADEAAAVADALAAAPELAPSVAAIVATSGAIAWLHAGRIGRALAATERALPAPPDDERLGDRGLAGLIAWSLARIESGSEWDAAEDRISRILQALLRRGDRVAAGPAAGLLGHLALVRGRPATAERLLREAVGHLELHDPRGLSVVIVAQIAIAAALRGDAQRADDACRHATRLLGERTPVWHEVPVLVRAEAWAAAARGETSRAWRMLLERAADLDALPVLRGRVLYDALMLGAPPAAVADSLGELAERCDSPMLSAAAHHAAALRSADASALLQAARELQEIGALLAAAEAAAAAAALFAGEGNTAAARRASAISQRLLGRCEGATTPALRATRTAASRLTRRERELAELAAAGRSNADIARVASVSVRTVESHLYHAMVKLGISRRDELAASLEPDPEEEKAVPTTDAGSGADPRE